MYDHALGGCDNYPVDRSTFRAILDVHRQFRAAAAADRAFLARAVDHLAATGIHQFLDLAGDIPSHPSVHAVATARNPDARVAYVTSDRTAHAHRVLRLRRTEGVTCIHHDQRDTDGLLKRTDLHQTLNVAHPIAVLLCGTTHLLDDETLSSILTQLTHTAATGSTLVLSTTTQDPSATATEQQQEAQLTAAWGRPTRMRSRESLEQILHGLPLLPPGLVDPQDWPTPTRTHTNDLRLLAGVWRLANLEPEDPSETARSREREHVASVPVAEPSVRALRS